MEHSVSSGGDQNTSVSMMQPAYYSVNNCFDDDYLGIHSTASILEHIYSHIVSLTF